VQEENAMKACLFLLPLVLAACMSTPESATHATPATAINTSAPVSSAALARYRWKLRDAVDADNKRIDALFGQSDKPLQLDFTTDRVSVSHACNRISGAYTIVEGHLVTANLMHTMMACSDRTLTQREEVIKSVLQGRPMLILTADHGAPLLTLAAESGQSLTFAGTPTAQGAEPSEPAGTSQQPRQP
jgi:heat shock protein HslJ